MNNVYLYYTAYILYVYVYKFTVRTHHVCLYLFFLVYQVCQVCHLARHHLSGLSGVDGCVMLTSETTYLVGEWCQLVQTNVSNLQHITRLTTNTLQIAT